MADIVVAAAVIRKAVDILGNLGIEEWSLLYWLHEDIKWIQAEMIHIHSYLADDDVEAKQDVDANNIRNAWKTNFRNNITDLADDIEDIMEVYSPWMTMRNRRRGFTGFLMSCIFCDCCTGHCLGMKIKGVRKRVEDIKNAKTIYGTTGSSGSSTRDTWDARRTFSHIDEPNIVGFEGHIKNLKAKLLNRNLQHSVISIVGMPGLGKTTLARKVYNSVKSEFECSAWICVSQDPSVKNLLQAVAKQVRLVEESVQKLSEEWNQKLKEEWEKKVKEEWEEWEQYVHLRKEEGKQYLRLRKEELEQDVDGKLYEFLSEKRYVIVVDDIWDEKAWEALKVGIPVHCENGSRIIITSRNKSVGLYIGGDSSLHELLPLNQDDSWKLFSKIVMNPIQSTNGTSDSTELENIGWEITKRCGGMPLAIVVTAGVLISREKTEFQWKLVLDSMGQEEDEISKILALSYKDLPIKLKPCFLYLGIFPEDREISAFQLINMWVAERFVEAGGVQLLEEVGEDYLNELIARNLVQAVRRRYDGRIKSCRIHDLLHNLCILEAVKSNFFNTSGNVRDNFGTRVRRVSILGSSIGEYISLKNQTPKVRALLCFNGEEELERNQLKSLLGEFRYLRVLTIYCKSVYLPDEIGSLTYLSYFELKGEIYGHGQLPSTMGNLKKLLTLNVEGCHGVYFPTFIWKMKQLRHVLLPRDCSAPRVRRRSSTGLIIKRWSHNHKIEEEEEEEVSLPNLQTLSNVPGECMEPGWLRKLTNIRKLRISNPSEQYNEVLSDDATPVSEKLEDLQLCMNQPWFNLSWLNLPRLNLSGNKNLHKLRLEGFINGKLPKHNELPQNLTKLVFKDCELEEDPLEHLKNLPKLKFLKLGRDSYSGKKMMCSYGDGGADAFPKLQVLDLDGLYNLHEIYVEGGGMPTLKELRVHECYSLTEMPNRLRDIIIHY